MLRYQTKGKINEVHLLAIHEAIFGGNN